MLVTILRGVVIDRVIRMPGESVEVVVTLGMELLRAGKAEAGGLPPASADLGRETAVMPGYETAVMPATKRRKAKGAQGG